MKKLNNPELGLNVISCAIGSAALCSGFFDITGAYIGFVLGAIIGILCSFKPEEKKPSKQTPSKTS
jgi:hypothetical protein